MRPGTSSVPAEQPGQPARQQDDRQTAETPTSAARMMAGGWTIASSESPPDPTSVATMTASPPSAIATVAAARRHRGYTSELHLVDRTVEDPPGPQARLAGGGSASSSLSDTRR